MPKVGATATNPQTGDRFLYDGQAWILQAPVPPSTDGSDLRDRFIIGAAYDGPVKLQRAQDIYGANNVRVDREGNLLFRANSEAPWGYVNPPGLDLGDVAGAGREIISTLGSIPGGIGGTPLGPAGIVGGAAASGTAASQWADYLAADMSRNIARERGDVPSPGQTPGQAGVEALNELMYGAGLGTVGSVAGRSLSNITRSVPDLADAYTRQGLKPPSLGGIVDSPLIHMSEAALAQAPLGSGIMRPALSQYSVNAQRLLDNAAESVANGRPIPSTVNELGLYARDAAARSKADFQTQASAAYEPFDAYNNLPATPSNYYNAVDRYISGSPNTSASIQEDLLKFLPSQEVLPNGSAIPYTVGDISQARHAIGNALKPTSNINTPSLGQGRLRDLYGQLTADRNAALPPDVAKQLSAVDNWYGTQKELRNSLDTFLGNQKTDALRVGNALLSPRQLTPTIAQNLQGALTPDDFNTLRAGIIKQQGIPLASSNLPVGSASIDRAMRHTTPGSGAYAPETRELIFGNSLNDFHTINRPILDIMRQRNTSNTAQTQAFHSLFSSGKNIAKALALAVPAKLSTSPGAINLFSKIAPPRTAQVMPSNRQLSENIAKRLNQQNPDHLSRWAELLMRQRPDLVGAVNIGIHNNDSDSPSLIDFLGL